MLQKQWNVIIYGNDGTTVKTQITNAPARTFRDASGPSFSCRINGGFGECVLDLVGADFRFDKFGEGTTIAHSFIVDLDEVDANNPLGRRIYRGYISKYESYIDAGGNEGVKVTCLGLVSLLTKSYYGGFGTTSQAGKDPQAIGEAIVDHFNTVFGGNLLSYTHGTSTQAVGTNVSYDFTDMTWFDALTEVGNLAGSGWWWKIDENGKFWLQPKPGSATHDFTIGVNVQSVTITKDAEKVINDVEVRYKSSGVYDTHDSASEATYGTGSSPSGKYSTIISDTSIADSGGAQQRAATELLKKDAYTSAVIEVNCLYDIESIKVGQTCRLLNYDLSNTSLSTNMLIVGLTYTGDVCRVECERSQTDFGLELQRFING